MFQILGYRNPYLSGPPRGVGRCRPPGYVIGMRPLVEQLRRQLSAVWNDNPYAAFWIHVEPAKLLSRPRCGPTIVPDVPPELILGHPPGHHRVEFHAPQGRFLVTSYAAATDSG